MDKSFDSIIIGAGIAGLVTALELLKKGRRVLLLDAQERPQIGGLARTAFGGMALIDTPEQRRKGIKDSPETALSDWLSFAEFGEADYWPKAWASHYVERSRADVYDYVRSLGVSFLPAVNWVERGQYTPGNSLPRYHILWGCSLRLIEKLVARLSPFEGTQLKFRFGTKVSALTKHNGRVTGCVSQCGDEQLEFFADNTIVACGGFTGDIGRVKKQWPQDWPAGAPEIILNGAHPSNDGLMHDQVERVGGNLTHLDKMWNYAAGIPHPSPEFEGQGLSLIPCKSALWLDHSGERIESPPLVTGFDTHQMCKQLSQLARPYSWQLLNWRIAAKEFAISGAEYNVMIRDRKFPSLLKEILFGNHRLVRQMERESDHFIVAATIDELSKKMNRLTNSEDIKPESLRATVASFDQMVARGPSFWNDDQLRRIMQTRQWGSDKLRTCYPKPILETPPLIAIKVNLISRKSLGGIQTNLNSQVLDQNEQLVQGLFAVGEAAGFGGGGASGKRSLEGTFLSGCILTARQAAKFL